MFKLFPIILFVCIILLLSSIEIFPQQKADTSKVLVKFNEPMSRDGIFNINNYVIYRDDDTPVEIFKIGVVPGDTAVVLFTEKQYPQYSYKIIINNLKDKSGNIISKSHKMAFY